MNSFASSRCLLRLFLKYRQVPGLCQKGISTQHENTAAKDMPDLTENPYKEPPVRCILCDTHIDYKNIQLLSQFVSPYSGRIYGRRITGLCEKKQREISKAIKKAQQLGFMPVTLKDPLFIKDPNICNIRHPE
ncbi:28S ribosomal protein S18c, mitochondrial isoform X2 [Protopterus annectens]|uniref:28S ribosomal protein S18c, mitochondrial isoform X2 n=1 Tax=Protopterus annectens TaxID=7888 RepID=UPI001CFC2E97|nr:28S ribosomal protein S18c, mitochondrial isoform X2 [Protopterus annectens]